MKSTLKLCIDLITPVNNKRCLSCFVFPQIDDIIDSTHSESSEASSATTSSNKAPRGFKRPPQKADLVLEKIAKKMDELVQIPQNPKKPYDAFGEHIAEKLRSLPQLMIPICEKLINDAIFLAEIEQLNYTSKLVTENVLGLDASTPRNPIMTAYMDAVGTLSNSM